MNNPEKLDCVKSTIMKVGGRNMRSTMMLLLSQLTEATKLAGPDGVVTVTVSAHVPLRRLNAAPNPTG